MEESFKKYKGGALLLKVGINMFKKGLYLTQFKNYTIKKIN